MKLVCYGCYSACRSHSLLTRSSLRLTTLSSASGKEGELQFLLFTGFFAGKKLQLPSLRRRRREGGRAKQRPGESTGARLLRYILLFFILTTFHSHLSAQNTDDAASLRKEAAQLNRQGKFAEAFDKYTLALKIDPDNNGANYGIAYSLMQVGKGMDGISYLEKVVKSNSPLVAPAYDLLGSIYDKNHDSAKAIEAFNAAIKIDPKYQRSYYNLGLVYFRDKKYDEAEKYAIEAIKLDPTHANSHRMYALVCFHQNKRAEALLGLCSFILLEPNTPRSAEAYGNIQHILAGGILKQDPGAPLPMVSANDIALNLAITKETGEANKKKYPTPADLLNAELTAIFNALGPLADKETGNDFFKNYYADFFYKLAQLPNMLAFAHMVSGGTAESAEWIKNNTQKMEDLDGWVKGAERGF